jgi:hypothetical protein
MVNVLGVCALEKSGSRRVNEPQWPSEWCLRSAFPFMELSQPWLSCACAVMVVRGHYPTANGSAAVDCDPPAFSRLYDAIVNGDRGTPTISKYIHTLVVQCEKTPNVTELQGILGTTMPSLSYIGITRLLQGTNIGTAAPTQSARSPAAAALVLPQFDAPRLHAVRLKSVPLVNLSDASFDQCSELRYFELTGAELTALPSRIFDKNKQLNVIRLHSNSLSTFPDGLFRNNVKLKNVRTLKQIQGKLRWAVLGKRGVKGCVHTRYARTYDYCDSLPSLQALFSSPVFQYSYPTRYPTQPSQPPSSYFCSSYLLKTTGSQAFQCPHSRTIPS